MGKRKKLRRSYIKSVPSKKQKKYSIVLGLIKRASSIANSGVKKTKITESLETQDDIEILTELDVLVVSNIYFLLPPFKPLSSLGKQIYVRNLGLTLQNQ